MNIYAIGAGFATVSTSETTRKQPINCSLCEMISLGVALGAQRISLRLSGFGDLMATCNGDWSRTGLREVGW